MKKLIGLLPVLIILLVLNGCGEGKTTSTPAATPATKETAAPKEHGGHEAGGHSHAAPHGGLVNSIGNFHVELVHDMAASKLVFYILGGDGTSANPIESKPILGQFKIEGGSDFTPFTLNAAPQAGEKEGMSSRFEGPVVGLEMGKSYELFLRVTIEDRAYRTAYQLTPGKAATVARSFRCPMKEHTKIYPQPGKCEICGMELIEIKDGKSEHADHAAKHGGTLFMASDNWTHLEGTLASATEFRIYIYDNFTQPVSAKGYEGTAEVIRQDKKGDDIGTALKLKLLPSADGSYLTAEFPAEYVTPLAFTTHLMLQKGEKPYLFNFTFDKPAGK